MLPEKIGHATKLTLIVDRLKALHIAKHDLPPDVPIATTSCQEIQSENTKSVPVGQEEVVQIDDSKDDRTGDIQVEKNAASFTGAECSKKSNEAPMLPKYSEIVTDLLENGDILKEWNKFIEETAYHVLKLPYKFESKDLYQDLGRALYTKYPCVGFASGSNPWAYFTKKLSQKLRNIRWKWNRRSENGTEPEEKRKKVPRQFVDLEEKDNKQADTPEAHEEMEKEVKKTEKEQNKPLILKLLKATFKKRRHYIQTSDANIKTITDRYSALKTSCYLEREFFLIKPELSQTVLSERWTKALCKLNKVFGIKEGNDSSDIEEERDDSKLLKIIKKVQQRIRYISKGSSKEADLLTAVNVKEVNLVSKKKAPPRLVIVQNSEQAISNCFIVADGLELSAGNDLQFAMQLMLMTYYVFDLSYPKCHQLLGFLQMVLLQDGNQFFKSSNYTKFEKVYTEV
ncbi:uncharacterized protein LOC143072936 isoform X2 [Mytilus galloprovincialis]